MIILRSPKFTIDKLAFSPDGGWLVSPRQGHGILRWTLSEANAPTLHPVVPDWRTAVHFTPDGKSMILDGKRVYIRDMMTEDEVEAKFSRSVLGRVSLTKDGQGFIAVLNSYYASTSSRVVFRSISNPKVDVWSVGVSRNFCGTAFYLPGNMQFVTVEYQTGEGYGIGEGRVDPGLVFVTRDALTGLPISETCYPGRGYIDVVPSPDFQYFATTLKGKSIAVFRTQDTHAPVAVIKNFYRPDLTGVAFHPSGGHLAVTSDDATVKVYDTTTWKVATKFSWAIGPLRGVAFSQDGLLAAAGGIGKIVVWDWDL
jgi:WD40 repeat protein